VPKLEFYWDEVVDSALRIESILQEIREDPDDGSEDPK
jgi:ribosome-binding factor A